LTNVVLTILLVKEGKKLLPHLSQSNLGRKTKVLLWRIVRAIIYRLKAGCQWCELPIGAFCSKILICWDSIFFLENGQRMVLIPQPKEVEKL